MQTENLSQRHWEWPSSCYSMAASPPSCHPAHSLSSIPSLCWEEEAHSYSHALVLLFLQGPALRTWSCLVEFGCHLWHGCLCVWPPSAAGTSALQEAPIKRQAGLNKGLRQDRTAQTQGGREYAGGGACSCWGRADCCLWVSCCCDGIDFHTTEQGNATSLMFCFCSQKAKRNGSA